LAGGRLVSATHGVTVLRKYLDLEQAMAMLFRRLWPETRMNTQENSEFPM
jgi:hypothetical protein